MNYVTLLQTIIHNGKVDGITAKAVADYYSKRKLIKYNAHDGYRIVHGGLFDYDVIQSVAKDAAK